MRVILLVLLAATAHATTYFVSPTAGSNANSCATAQSSSTPKQTISAGVSCLSVAGDILTVMNGTYGNEGNTGANSTVVSISLNGTSGSHFKIQAQNAGQAILDGGATQAGSSTSCNGAGSYFSFPSGGASFLDLVGLHLQNLCENAITTGSSGSVHDLLLSQMEIDHVGVYTDTGGFGTDGIFIRNPVPPTAAVNSNLTIDRSYIHDIGRTSSGSSGVLLHLDHGVYVDYLPGLTVTNTKFTNITAGWGIQLRGVAGTQTIAGNTFGPSVHSGVASEPGEIVLDNEDQASGGISGSLTITDNIFYQPQQNAAIYGYLYSGFSSGAGCATDHNNLPTGGSMLSATAGGTCNTTNIVTGDPKFVNIASPYDLHLQTGSPAIGAGVPLSVLTVDFAGTIRPNPPSIGAYEGSGGGVVVPVVVQTHLCSAQTYTGSVSCSFGAATTAGNLVAIAFMTYAGQASGSSGTLNSVTDNSADSCVQAVGARSVNTLFSTGTWNDVFYCPNVKGGATAFTPTTSVAGGLQADVYMWEISGVNGIDAAAHLNSQPATTTPTGASVTTAGSADLIISLLHPGGVSVTSVNGPWTQDDVSNFGLAHLLGSSAGAYAPTWNIGSATWASSTVAFVSNSYTFTVTATDSTNPTHQTASQAYTVVVSGACAISPTSLGPYTVGQSGSGLPQTFTETGCTGTWSSSGAFPTGLTFNTGTGVLSGTITASGTFTPSVSFGTATNPYTIIVNQAPSITTTSPLPDATQGQPYSRTLVVANGTGTVTCAVTAGSLIGSSLILNSNCQVTGTGGTPGVYNFTVTPTDSKNVAGTAKAFSLTVDASAPGGGTVTNGSVTIAGSVQRF